MGWEEDKLEELAQEKQSYIESGEYTLSELKKIFRSINRDIDKACKSLWNKNPNTYYGY